VSIQKYSLAAGIAVIVESNGCLKCLAWKANKTIDEIYRIQLSVRCSWTCQKKTLWSLVNYSA